MPNLRAITRQYTLFLAATLFMHSAIAIASNEYDSQPVTSGVPKQSSITASSSNQFRQNCIVNCFEGNNRGTVVMNQYGPPKLMMTDEQKSAITKAMRPYAGLKFTIFRHEETLDSSDWADKLRDALKEAGMICTKDGNGTAFYRPSAVPQGISINIGNDNIDAATALAKVLRNVGLTQGPIPLGINKVRSDAFDIVVAPSR